MLPPRQQKAAAAEKRFMKVMIKIADKADDTPDPQFEYDLALAMHQEHVHFIGTDPLAKLVYERQKGGARG